MRSDHDTDIGYIERTGTTMGTNFYLMTKSRDKRDKWFTISEFSLTDSPIWGYEIHIAKTSCGWLPSFEAHKKVRSVRDIKQIYDEGEFQIFDEYGQEYDWDGFEKRVLNFNRDNSDALSHLKEFNKAEYRGCVYKDDQGYEFVDWEFC